MAGNAMVLKHAPNVPQCALAIEEMFRDCGLPDGLFASLMIEVEQVAEAIASPHVHAVTLTRFGIRRAQGGGVRRSASEEMRSGTGRLRSVHRVARRGSGIGSQYGGGLPAFSIAGNHAFAAKRLIVVAANRRMKFLRGFKTRVEALRLGDPMAETTQIGPIARSDLRESFASPSHGFHRPGRGCADRMQTGRARKDSITSLRSSIMSPPNPALPRRALRPG